MDRLRNVNRENDWEFSVEYDSDTQYIVQAIFWTQEHEQKVFVKHDYSFSFPGTPHLDMWKMHLHSHQGGVNSGWVQTQRNSFGPVDGGSRIHVSCRSSATGPETPSPLEQTPIDPAAAGGMGYEHDNDNDRVRFYFRHPLFTEVHVQVDIHPVE